jgi:hypothetical protein
MGDQGNLTYGLVPRVGLGVNTTTSQGVLSSTSKRQSFGPQQPRGAAQPFRGTGVPAKPVAEESPYEEDVDESYTEENVVSMYHSTLRVEKNLKDALTHFFSNPYFTTSEKVLAVINKPFLEKTTLGFITLGTTQVTPFQIIKRNLTNKKITSEMFKEAVYYLLDNKGLQLNGPDTESWHKIINNKILSGGYRRKSRKTKKSKKSRKTNRKTRNRRHQ